MFDDTRYWKIFNNKVNEYIELIEFMHEKFYRQMESAKYDAHDDPVICFHEFNALSNIAQQYFLLKMKNNNIGVEITEQMLDQYNENI